MKAFVRQLGHQSGVQLNPLEDRSEIPVSENYDQCAAIMMRATRGRIDKPFAVNPSNFQRKLGKGEPIRVSALNEAWAQLYEAFQNGLYTAIVHRLVTKNAKIKWAVAKVEPAESGEKITFTTSENEPEGEFLFAVRHLECFNDGIRLEFHADDKRENGEYVPNDSVSIRLLDGDGEAVYSFSGSLNRDARDESGNPSSVVHTASLNQNVEFLTGMPLEKSFIKPDSAAYGYDANGREKWAKSEKLMCFDEGGTGYTVSDYDRAKNELKKTPHNYGFILSGGTQSPALILKLAQLAYETDTPMRFDIPAKLTPEEAVVYVEQLNIGSQKEAHLISKFWTPLKAADASGVNPKGFLGTSSLNVAYECLRNANKNAKGLAKKQSPIAGKDWPINRSNITQTYSPDEYEKSLMAKAGINYVVYEEYTGGGRYAFIEQITSAPVAYSLKKQNSVVAMDCHNTDVITRRAKDLLQKPMSEACRRMTDFMKELFEAEEAAGWLVPSDDPQMGGLSHMYKAVPSEEKPYDVMIVSYACRYEGAVRQIEVSHAVTR